MELRAYMPADCRQMAELFTETVHTVNAKDYTKEQLDAWADGRVDLAAWNRSFLEHHTVVAWEHGRIVGFGDMDDSGYLDRLYVHRAHQGEGIGTAICDALEQAAGRVTFTTHASITARAFFGHRGYRVLREQTVLRHEVPLINFVMEKDPD
ncbi:MAG: GNAT family N-acetyltransferase [Lachnospiraceae bacterium]